MADFNDLVQMRYSCRNYLPTKIDNSLIEQVLETAHFAPSATNAQPWRVFVLNTPESLAKARQAYNREWFATAPAVLLRCFRLGSGSHRGYVRCHIHPGGARPR